MTLDLMAKFFEDMQATQETKFRLAKEKRQMLEGMIKGLWLLPPRTRERKKKGLA